MRQQRYSVVRTKEAGAFAAVVKSTKATPTGMVAELQNSRRLWYWKGAASLSQLALEGVKCPNECKFPVALPKQTVIGVIELIPMTPKAVANINAVPVWAM